MKVSLIFKRNRRRRTEISLGNIQRAFPFHYQSRASSCFNNLLETCSLNYRFNITSSVNTFRSNLPSNDDSIRHHERREDIMFALQRLCTVALVTRSFVITVACSRASLGKLAK